VRLRRWSNKAETVRHDARVILAPQPHYEWHEAFPDGFRIRPPRLSPRCCGGLMPGWLSLGERWEPFSSSWAWLTLSDQTLSGVIVGDGPRSG
jgi:hypothetical protein